ncbi:cyclase [Thiosulfatimonas sediminis]|uniref:Cyclase n=1 Tax=Thiosulfatimonas sediminis TaxID=2675054 RepID=A0A6F8PUQ3_9GAMM|nr:START domain-containing protein [Thiosulfatimonas sediminis]BBP45839.1 cyclase [Thiosulfatimonas sediminis]
MQRKTYLSALGGCMLLFSAQSIAWQEQTTVENNQHVQVWTQSVADTNFKAFRGQVTIAAPMQSVFDFIGATEKSPEWYFKTKSAKLLKQLNAKEFLIYSITTAPWPVSDRDSITRVKVEDELPGEITIRLRAEPEELPPQEGMVRITKLDGYWHLKKLDEEHTEVTLEVAAEPGGLLPSCLANSMAYEMPYESLKNLKRILEKNQ